MCFVAPTDISPVSDWHGPTRANPERKIACSARTPSSLILRSVTLNILTFGFSSTLMSSATSSHAWLNWSQSRCLFRLEITHHWSTSRKVCRISLKKRGVTSTKKQQRDFVRHREKPTDSKASSSTPWKMIIPTHRNIVTWHWLWNSSKRMSASPSSQWISYLITTGWVLPKNNNIEIIARPQPRTYSGVFLYP